MNFQITANPSDTSGESSLLIIEGEVFIIDTDKIEFAKKPPHVRKTKKIWNIHTYEDESKVLVTTDNQNKIKTFVELLFDDEISVPVEHYLFINNNNHDYRKSNIRPILHDLIERETHIEQNLGYVIHDLIRYNVPKRGQCAGKIMNPTWIVTDETFNKILLMFCNENTYTKLSIDSLPKLDEFCEIYKSNWHYHSATGYIQSHVKNTCIYLHQYLTNFHGQKKNRTAQKNMSVDHINQDKLDNQMTNLRIVSQSVQNQNRGKRTRARNAQRLPPELIGVDIPVYVTYATDNYLDRNGPKNAEDARIILPEDIYSEKTVERYVLGFQHFFRIEKKIPGTTQRIRWTGTKAMDIPILVKLEEAKFTVNYLNEHNEFPSLELRAAIIAKYM